mgnify:CR=1 FL=1
MVSKQKILIVDDEEIRELNREFRDIDKSTDVLSFPLGEDGVYDYNPETDALIYKKDIWSYKADVKAKNKKIFFFIRILIL